jgi:excisionase family DNA binding protein
MARLAQLSSKTAAADNTKQPQPGRRDMPATTVQPLWTVDDTATYLGVPVETLYAWRKKRTGPPAARVGKHLRYDPDTVRAWFAARCHN